LLAPGAAPVRLPIPGAERPHVHTLRTLADSRAIVASAVGAERAVVVGASFIGLEVAASLIERGLDVAVVAPEAVPMARVLGDELGAFVRGLHEGRGVRFHLGRTVAEIGEGTATLDDGTRLAADLVVLGVGVRPELALAESAGLALDHGVVVDRYLRTSTEGIWAAGDVARWPDSWSGEAIRVEHWVVAERQGQTAARNILGHDEPFAAAPFFWSQHYDVAIHYVGHAESWDAAEIHGDVAKKSCLVAYRKSGKPLAVASIGRDRDALRIAAAMERGDAGAVEAILTETDP
jgi:NADPH-dependent 2,4-dienoyl-CoA reductase/sulfur reductase-like enzyme